MAIFRFGNEKQAWLLRDELTERCGVSPLSASTDKQQRRLDTKLPAQNRGVNLRVILCAKWEEGAIPLGLERIKAFYLAVWRETLFTLTDHLIGIPAAEQQVFISQRTRWPWPPSVRLKKRDEKMNFKAIKHVGIA